MADLVHLLLFSDHLHVAFSDCLWIVTNQLSFWLFIGVIRYLLLGAIVLKGLLLVTTGLGSSLSLVLNWLSLIPFSDLYALSLLLIPIVFANDLASLHWRLLWHLVCAIVDLRVNAIRINPPAWTWSQFCLSLVKSCLSWCVRICLIIGQTSWTLVVVLISSKLVLLLLQQHLLLYLLLVELLSRCQVEIVDNVGDIGNSTRVGSLSNLLAVTLALSRLCSIVWLAIILSLKLRINVVTRYLVSFETCLNLLPRFYIAYISTILFSLFIFFWFVIILINHTRLRCLFLIVVIDQALNILSGQLFVIIVLLCYPWVYQWLLYVYLFAVALSTCCLCCLILRPNWNINFYAFVSVAHCLLLRALDVVETLELNLCLLLLLFVVFIAVVALLILLGRGFFPGFYLFLV